MIDTVWMMSRAKQLSNVPVWIGFHFLLICYDSPTQIVSYLPPISESASNKAVALETMKQSKEICKEGKQ